MSDDREFKTHEEFFAKTGERYLYPQIYGMKQPISIEELYQHFKSRLYEELAEAFAAPPRTQEEE